MDINLMNESAIDLNEYKSTGMTELQTLFTKVRDLKYPEAMAPISGKIDRIAFFPGGKGTFDKSQTISDKRIMIIGQDFDCEANLDKYRNQTDEEVNKNATWRNLFSFLKEVNIQPDDCFFTNAIMGVRKGNISTGKSPAFRDKEFLRACQDFFLYQLEVQKPEMILVLGMHTARFLSGTTPELHTWKGIKSFSQADKDLEAVKKEIRFPRDFRANLVLLTHPSFRPVNIHRRSFSGFNGHEAEVQMVKSV